MNRTKTLYSIDLAPLVLFGLIGWIISIDGPTINAIAIAFVWAYFEIRRQNDLRKAEANAAAKAAPIAAETARIDAAAVKATADRARQDVSLDRLSVATGVEIPPPAALKRSSDRP